MDALVRANADVESGLGKSPLAISAEQLRLIAEAADGDVRRALSLLELVDDLATDRQVDDSILRQALADRVRRFDKGGEQFYDQISALHKSVRNSNPDAALYWIARMLDGGCDPAAWTAYERLGSPEGDLALAALAVHLAMAPKSNAVYAAYKAALADVQKNRLTAGSSGLAQRANQTHARLGIRRQISIRPGCGRRHRIRPAVFSRRTRRAAVLPADDSRRRSADRREAGCDPETSAGGQKAGMKGFRCRTPNDPPG
ncbi:MAG: hypothetical protein IPK97_11400 [Ahniella sp.]|nr:hypothetical protein [Ahniella sp.]